jgi:hypothetical protein
MDEPRAEDALTAGTEPESSGATVGDSDNARVRRGVRGRQVISILAALAVIALLAGGAWVRGPDRHEEGQGELAMLGDGATSSTISDFATAASGRPIAFGLSLCHLRGDAPTLDGVSATTVVGDGFRVIGTGVRTFTPSPSHTPVFSVDGWPPDPTLVPVTLQPVAGYQVSSRCGDGIQIDGLPYTELLVAMERTSPAGGGWFGFEIAYTVGGRQRVLHSTWQYGICGTALPCSGAGESPTP